jgi:uncharacterized membrane protein YgcG
MRGMNTAVIGLILLAVPLAAMGQSVPYQQPSSNIQDVNGFLRAIDALIGWIFTFLLIGAVVIVLYAAFLYLTASGDSEKVGQANHILRYAVIAIAIAVLSRSIPFVVKNFVQTTAGGGGGTGGSNAPGGFPYGGGSGNGLPNPVWQGDTGPLPTLPVPGPLPPGPVNG